METTEGLVRRAQDRDAPVAHRQDAFGELVRRFQDLAYGYAYALLGDPHLAQDAAQEAFLAAYRQLLQLREPAAFPGWLRRIVRTHCLRLRRGQAIAALPLEVGGDAEAADLAMPDGDPAILREWRETRDLVGSVVAALPERQREVVVLFCLGGYAQQDVAAFLGVPVTTVKKRLQAARTRMQERMLDVVRDTLQRQGPSGDERFVEAVQFFTAFEAAAGEGEQLLVELLLLDGLDVNARDRDGRTLLCLAANLGLALVVGSVPFAAWLGRLHVEQLYGVAFAMGTLSLCFGVAYAAYLPSLVGRVRLLEANSKLQASVSMAAVAGPGITGVLAQMQTAPVAMAFDACSYVVAALSLALIRAAEPVRGRPEGKPSIRREVEEGLRSVLSHPVLRTLGWTSLVWNLFGSAGNVVWILFATREVGISAAILGSLFAVAGGGAVLGALLAQPVAERYGIGRAVVGTMCAITAANAILPMAGGPALLVVAMLGAWALLSGIAIPVNLVGVASLRQSIAPGELQGRVNATLQFAAALTVPIGSLLGGALGDLIGTRASLGIMAGGFALVTVGLVLSPVPAIRLWLDLISCAMVLAYGMMLDDIPTPYGVYRGDAGRRRRSSMSDSLQKPARSPAVLRVAAGADRFGEQRSLGISSVAFKVTSQDSGGLFVLENTFRAKGGPARHLHYDQDEWFYALEGEFLVEVADDRFSLRPGDSLLAPRNVPHVWASVGDHGGRILVAFQPAGKMEAFFRIVTQANAMPPQDPELWRAHGMELLGPPLALG